MISLLPVARAMRKRLTSTQRSEALVLVLFATWLLFVVIAPFTLPAGSVSDLSGRAGSIDNPEEIAEMNPFAASIYWLGDANCHQLASRSYFLNGNEMPFCARDLGIFIGLVLGMALALVIKTRPPVLLVLLGFLPMALDGGWQLLTSYESTNEIRLLTGILAGVAAAMLIHLIALNVRSEGGPRTSWRRS